jgi:hypothetical protein
MKEKRKRNNVETLFGVSGIPGDNEIRRLIDPINPAKFRPVYDQALRMEEPYGILDEFRMLDRGVPLGLDWEQRGPAGDARDDRERGRGGETGLRAERGETVACRGREGLGPAATDAVGG